MKVRTSKGLFPEKENSMMIGSDSLGSRGDLKKIHYLDLTPGQHVTYSAIANLINQIRRLISQGFEVRFLSVPKKIRSFLAKLDLQDVLKLE